MSVATLHLVLLTLFGSHGLARLVSPHDAKWLEISTVSASRVFTVQRTPVLAIARHAATGLTRGRRVCAI